MHRPRLALLSAAVTAAVLVLSGCGTTDDTGTAGSGADGTDNATKALDGVVVGGSSAAPTVTLKTKPLQVTVTTTKVVTPGKGARLVDGNSVSANYLMVNGKDGKQLDSSFGAAAAAMNLSDTKLLPGLRKGLVGQTVGSRVIVAMPPADAFGQAGNSRIGVGANDTVLFLVDVLSARTPLTSAQGTAVAPKAGLPTVVPGKDLKTAARVTVPKTDPPRTLVAQPLIKGNGPVVKSGQTIRVAYTGVIWATGKQFDSSANTDSGYALFRIGVGEVITGWDKSLVGQKVGSRVLVVVPPGDGYGSAGRPDSGISGTDTLVFVVDILDVS